MHRRPCCDIATANRLNNKETKNQDQEMEEARGVRPEAGKRREHSTFNSQLSTSNQKPAGKDAGAPGVLAVAIFPR
jgi:hypothetical protein